MLHRRVRRVVLALAVLFLVVWKLCADVEVDEEALHTRFLLDRPWVNRLPSGPRESVHVLMLLGQDRVGATIHGSQFRYLVNTVGYVLEGDDLKLEFLQERVRIKTRANAFECDGKAPKGLDLCLELSFHGKKLRLYSSKEWRLPHNVPAFFRGHGLDIDEQSAELTEQEIACEDCGPGSTTWFDTLEIVEATEP